MIRHVFIFLLLAINLTSLSQEFKLMPPVGHSSGLYYAQFSPDGKKIVTISWDRTAKIWDVVTGLLLADLRGHSEGVVSARFSPDGTKIITASADSTAKIWNATDGTFVAELKDADGIVLAQFSPDGTKIITTTEKSIVRIWNTSTRKPLAGFEGSSLASFSPDGRMVAMASDEIVLIWDASSGALITTLQGNTGMIRSIQFSADGKEIVTASADSTARIWDSFNGKSITVLKIHDWINSAQLSPDGKRIITVSDDTVKVWDTLTKRLIADLNGHTERIMSVQFSPDGKNIVTASVDKTAKIWDAISGTFLQDLKVHSSFLMSAQFSPDGKKIVTASWDHTAKIWDVVTGVLLADLKGHLKPIVTAGFTSDGKNIYIIPDDTMTSSVATFTSYKLWDVFTGTLLPDTAKKNDDISTLQPGPEPDLVFAVVEDSVSKILDLRTRALLAVLKGNTPYVMFAGFSPGKKNIVTTSKHNYCEVWNTSTGNQLYTFFIVDSTDYLTKIPTGYYKATPDAAKLLHYVTKDLKIITFEQLDIKYNRPDKVLEAIGCLDTALIESYRKAYYKRIKKLRIDTSSFKNNYTIPQAEFKNRDNIENDQKNKTLPLHIIGKSTVTLDRFNVWINEVPLYGQKGISLHSRGKKEIDTTITVFLSEGDNRVETSVLDVNGIESYRQPLFVKYIPEKKSPSRIYFIGIGINRFAESSHNLSWSVKDIRDLAGKFSSKGAVIDTLFDENVTKEKIIALKNKLSVTNEEDKVIIAYSGHGLLSSDYDYYLSTYSVDFNQPQQNGLPYEELENLLDGIKARKKLLLIDACHSGEVDKEEMKAYTIAKDSLDKNGVKGFILIPTNKNRLGIKNSFELMQELFVNVARGTGTTVISAAAGTQFALERSNLKNGVFTYCLLQGMNANDKLRISDLKKIVTEKVPKLTNGLQKPTFRSETQQYDWELW